MNTTDSYAESAAILNYRINTHQTTHFIPTLDEILTDKPQPDAYYNRDNFVEYLSNVHCLENLQFVVDLNRFIQNPTCKTWQEIQATFLMPEANSEINLPYNIKQGLVAETCPDLNAIERCKRAIYEDTLFNLYNEFLRHVRNKLASEHLASSASPGAGSVVYRRRSEIISPDTIAAGQACTKRSNSTTADYFGPGSDIVEHEVFIPTYTKSSISSSSNSASEISSPNSRGSSIGSIMDSFKSNVDSIKLKNVKKFKFRRFSNDG